MLEELKVNYNVCNFVATLKEQNYRSLALLRQLGFEHTVPGDGDEIVMGMRLDVVPFT